MVLAVSAAAKPVDATSFGRDVSVGMFRRAY